MGRFRTALAQSGCYRIILFREFLIYFCTGCVLNFFVLSLRSRQRFKEFARGKYLLFCRATVLSEAYLSISGVQETAKI